MTWLAVALLAGAVGLCIHRTRATRREVARLSHELADLTNDVRVPEPSSVDRDAARLFRGRGAGAQAVLDVLAREERDAQAHAREANPGWVGRRPA